MERAVLASAFTGSTAGEHDVAEGFEAVEEADKEQPSRSSANGKTPAPDVSER